MFANLGIEKLLVVAIKSLGIDADVLMAQLGQWLQWGEREIKQIDSRIYRMEQSLREVENQNAFFIAYIKAMNPSLNLPPALADETTKEIENHG